MNWFIVAVVFVFGLIIGSFLNVCIHRLPRGESIVHPRSHCPSCRRMIAAYDNIPVLSFLVLGARCRHCRHPISWQYPLVELLTGTLFVLCLFRWGLSPETIKGIIFSAAMVVLIFTDFHDRILPDRVNFPMMAVGLVFLLWTPLWDETSLWLTRTVLGWDWPVWALSVANGLLGALLGGGILFGLGQAWLYLKGVEGMGMGDVKMMAMAGLFLGPKLTILTLLVGSVVGSLVGGAFILLSGKDTDYELPFGSFLAVAALFSLFWGTGLVRAYLLLFR